MQVSGQFETLIPKPHQIRTKQKNLKSEAPPKSLKLSSKNIFKSIINIKYIKNKTQVMHDIKRTGALILIFKFLMSQK